jgi:hypothetical protein
VPEVNGRRVNQKSLFGCQFHEGVYIDLHVSKINFEPGDAQLFSQVLNSMRIDSVQRSSTELLQQASRLYLQHDYHGAIGPYSQALQLEKGHPELQKPLWYVLIDNLGMSYGITATCKRLKRRSSMALPRTQRTRSSTTTWHARTQRWAKRTTPAKTCHRTTPDVIASAEQVAPSTQRPR